MKFALRVAAIAALTFIGLKWAGRTFGIAPLVEL